MSVADTARTLRAMQDDDVRPNPQKDPPGKNPIVFESPIGGTVSPFGQLMHYRGFETPRNEAPGPAATRSMVERYSARSNSAVGVRAARRAGTAATTIASTTAPTAMAAT